jgi:hypothetical protein
VVSIAIPTLRRGRLFAAGAHLLASAAVAAIGALLIFRLWYPPPFERLAGGTSLFALLVSVDVVLGPALTFVAASPGKSLREFRRDLAVIVALQLAAFGYGIYTIASARPVFESFEIDRFRIVTAADIEPSELAKAPAEMRVLPWTGPRLIAAVKPTDPEAQLRSIDLGLAGFDLSMVPSNWRPYSAERQHAWAAARPAGLLTARHPELAIELTRIAVAAGRQASDLRFLPVLSRQDSWVALLAPGDVRIVGYLPVDGFF